jgi:hypothetical protein
MKWREAKASPSLLCFDCSHCRTCIPWRVWLSLAFPSFCPLFAVTVSYSRDVRNGTLTRPRSTLSRSCHKRDTGSRESQARSRAKEQLPIPLSSSSLRRPAKISLCRAAETEVVIFCYICSPRVSALSVASLS